MMLSYQTLAFGVEHIALSPPSRPSTAATRTRFGSQLAQFQRCCARRTFSFPTAPRSIARRSTAAAQEEPAATDRKQRDGGWFRDLVCEECFHGRKLARAERAGVDQNVPEVAGPKPVSVGSYAGRAAP